MNADERESDKALFVDNLLRPLRRDDWRVRWDFEHREDSVRKVKARSLDDGLGLLEESYTFNGRRVLENDSDGDAFPGRAGSAL